jgi:hypothetical protein
MRIVSKSLTVVTRPTYSHTLIAALQCAQCRKRMCDVYLTLRRLRLCLTEERATRRSIRDPFLGSHQEPGMPLGIS